jgi:hypothetical protein
VSEDYRPSLVAALDCFGLAATVTRPSPDDVPIETSAIWLPSSYLEEPLGAEFGRVAAKRAMALSRADVPTLPLNTEIQAPEQLGGTVLRWRVDGYAGQHHDHHRAYVVQVEE